MNQPKWLQQINAETEMTPFGTVTFSIKRHRNMTTKIESITQSSLKYDENTRAFADIEQLLNNLIASEFIGTLQFEVKLNSGNITAIAIKNKKTVNYRDKQ